MIVNEFDTVIVLGTYNRGQLLARSLRAYAGQGNRIAIVVMDDGSTDMTKVHCSASTLPIYYFYLGDKTDYRDSASFLNRGIKFALNELKAKYVFVTHPEIIVGVKTIEACIVGATDKDVWVSAKGYYLTAQQQAELDSVPWQSNLLNVRHLPNFYGQGASAEFSGNRDYLPESIETIPVWHSWIFGGGSAEMWRYFGGLTEFETWGSVDVDLLNRRNITGMRTRTPLSEDEFVVHQNHDDNAQRDMSKCMASLPHYSSKEEALKPHLI